MFRIFTFRQLACLSLFICLIMLFASLLNALSPIITANAAVQVQVPIIMYHHICDNASLWGDYVIPTTELEADFIYFKENNITPVSFAQLRAFVISGEPLPERPVVLTFDDGQKSFLTRVVPLLEKYCYPANVNVVGSLTRLYTQNGDCNDRYAYLNEADIITLSKNPLVEIGCHSYDFHTLGARRGAGRLKGEEDNSYKGAVVEDLTLFNDLYYSLTHDKAIIYAYPYGIRNDLLLELLKENHFTITLTCRESVNTLSHGSSLFELGRFNRPHGISSDYFFNKMF